MNEFKLSNGLTLTPATSEEINTVNSRIMIPGDGFKENDVITFPADAILFTQEYTINNDKIKSVVLPCVVTRKVDGTDTQINMSISINTLLGNAYKEANPLKATAKQHYFNQWLLDKLTADKPAEKVLDIVKGKSFKVARPDFHTVEKWIDVKDENGEVVKNARGNISKQPMTREEARGLIIPTKVRKGLCLSSN